MESSIVIIKDCIHGFIEIPELCRKFIDTSEFQRLRRVKQLGNACYTYPTAVHTRFEHSLGVMHLAGKAFDCICRNMNIHIDLRQKELVMVAGLLHDIGHKAYSHLYDEVTDTQHEYRSVECLKLINSRIKVLTSEEESIIEDMIIGNDKRETYKWLFQIINNNFCDVDVDRMDYLQRDAYHINLSGFQSDYIIQQMGFDKYNNLAFRKKAKQDIENLFYVRRTMFTSVYYHKTSCKLRALYGAMMSACSSEINNFEDDYQAETFLRKKYPHIFSLVDERKLNEAMKILSVKIKKYGTEKYLVTNNIPYLN